MNTEQTSINLYDNTYIDNVGLPAYPWRVSAGHKFEAMGSMAFFQSQMNNHHIVRQCYKDQYMSVSMIHGESHLYDLSYKINYSVDTGSDLIKKTKTQMLVEFKLLTNEALKKRGLVDGLKNIFRYNDKSKRALDFLQRHSKSTVEKLNLLVIGCTSFNSQEVVQCSTAKVFGPIWCIAYMPTAESRKDHPSVKKAMVMFDDFDQYAQCIHNATTPHHLFDMIEQKSDLNETLDFMETFKLP